MAAPWVLQAGKFSRVRSVMTRAVLFFMVGVLTVTIIPPQAVAAIAPPKEINRVDGNGNVIDTSNVKPLATAEAPSQKQAVDTKLNTDFGGLAPTAPKKDAKEDAKKNRTRLREDESKRTANSTEYINSDGTRSMEVSPAGPINYQENGKWHRIETRADKNNAYTPKKEIVDDSIQDKLGWTDKANAYSATSGRTKLELNPLDEGFSVTIGGKTLTITAVGARNVKPKLTTTATGTKILTYQEAWPGVDLVYELQGESLKENIVLKRPGAINSFVFAIEGAKLSPHPTVKGALAIEGLDPAQYQISPVSVNVNGKGILSETPARMTLRNKTIAVSLDADWLAAQPKESFPIAIDPTIDSSGTGPTDGAISYKSDGASCPGTTTCAGPNVGAIYDSSWKYWRTMVHLPINSLQGKNLIYAEMNLQRADDTFYYTGTSTPRLIRGTFANCFGYNCVSNFSWSGTTLGNQAYMDVSATVRDMMGTNQWNGWFILWGEEYNYDSYKQLNYGSYRLWLDYDSPTQMAVVNNKAPAHGSSVVTTQPSLSVDPVANDVDTGQTYYNFRIGTGSDAETGSVVSSGWTTNTQFTIPDGILQDGTTYYWHVYTADNTLGSYATAPTWTYSFKVDMRTGKDPTQAYDTVGPASVDLATGNLSTGNSSHSIAALGGSLGVGLDYNSPQRSRPGLVGEYWNNLTRSGAPTVKRVDTSVDFQWSNGSPSYGHIQTDNFSTRWTGYFIAPTTATYQFGANVDDGYTIYVNSAYYHTMTGTGEFFGGNVNLTAGQVVPIMIEYAENYGGATMQFKVKRDGGASVVVPSDWLQTGIRPVGAQNGLVGRYFYDSGSHTFPTNDNDAFMTRTDPIVSFDWKPGSPVPGGPSDDFMVRWTGYFVAPVAGSYEFGADSDDGARLIVNGNTTYNNWIDNPARAYGSAVTLTQGQIIPITLEYYEHGGSSHIELLVKGAVSEQVVPATWLIPQIPSLPAGWTLNADPDGNLSYDRLRATNNSVILYDSAGTTHEYTWTGSGYKAPVNEDGNLVRNNDGTYTLQDVDGRTYVFNTDGTLKETVTPLDDRKPAALKYTYGGTPARLTKITDGVTDDRYATVHYEGDSACTTPPSGFTATPPGMVCALKTSDGDITKFFYKDGKLARLERPGGAINDYGYDTDGRIVSMRDSLAADAIAAGVRTDNAEATTVIAYDAVGRVASITAPAPTASATRAVHTYEYLIGATQKHITGAPEPNGFSQRVEYDATYRTTKSIDVANLATQTEWHSVKDLVLSNTDPTGLKTTNHYDDADRPSHSYGPAPSAWYGTDRAPLSTYANQVPHSETRYDENIKGLAAAYYSYHSASQSLNGAPKLHGTGIRNDTTGDVSNYFGANSPITGTTDNWGMRLTGKFRLPNTGNHTFRFWSDNGMRVWIDDQLVVNDWANGVQRNHPTYVFNNTTANSLHKIQIDYYHTTGDANITAYITPPSSSETSAIGTYLTPAYNLATTQIAYDANLGNTVSNTNYGTRPEFGLATSTTLDPTGLNYTNSATYETPGTGYLRQTSKTLPGGTVTNYEHYGQTETADNPCTPATEAIHQGGNIKKKIEADPDGAGTQTPRTISTVYDAAGRTVATRYNNESWTCNTYDTRGRNTQTVIPALGSEAGRTVTNLWSVSGNPLKTAISDANGAITSEVDLLGRLVSYVDAIGTTTGYEYDNLGRLTRKYGDVAEQNFTYDNYDRLTQEKYDNTIVAVPHYDAYGRISSIDYPAAGNLKLNAVNRDNNGRMSRLYYILNDGTEVTDEVVRSQSGIITNDIVWGSSGGSLWYNYTYDKASRLTGATVGSNSFSYGFGTQHSSCSSSTNPNSGKNSNRTTQTINGTTTTFCYDYADRLVSSSDPVSTNVLYDTHGNMKSIGQSTKLELHYDSSDRNWGLVQANASGNGAATYYSRDVLGRVIAREHDSITNWNWTLLANHYSGFTGPGDSPDVLRDSNWNIVEKYVTLPGGVLLTVKPQQSTQANKHTYSLPNIHGDTLLTTNGLGNNTSTGNGPSGTFTYDPFGNVLSGSTFASNLTGGGSYAWAGPHQKATEQQLMHTPIQMGARVYLPSLGRFAQVDPIDGGTPNNYVYPPDPVNIGDYTGRNSAAIAQNSFGIALYSWNIPVIGPALSATATVVGTIALYSQAVNNNAKAQGNSKGNARNVKGYTPTTRPGGVAFRHETVRTDAHARAMAYVAGQLAMGNKPMARGMPIFAPEGQQSINGKPLSNPGQMFMSKYRYRYNDASGSTIEVHYTIDEIKREFEDLKIK